MLLNDQKEAKCRITVIGYSIDTKDLMASTKLPELRVLST